VFNVVRDFRSLGAQGRRRVVNYFGDHLERVLAPKWNVTHQHFIEDDTQRPYVRPAVDCAPLQLLGRHVGGVCQNWACILLSRIAENPHYAEIEDAHALPAEDQI
jgi:hypothetical protein